MLVDPGPESSLPTLLEAIGDEQPRAILLTHIHLDHAAATGAMVARWPDLQVYVHERGAPHLIDPSKLLASAERLYGDQLEYLWGKILPVPEANVHVLSGGETVLGMRVAYTPGHASHHVAYLHEESGTAFTGDVAACRIPPSNLVVPPTPPPDIDVELWEESLDTIAAWAPERLALTHFGAIEDDAPPTSRPCARPCARRPSWPASCPSPSTRPTSSAGSGRRAGRRHRGRGHDRRDPAGRPHRLPVVRPRPLLAQESRARSGLEGITRGGS